MHIAIVEDETKWQLIVKKEIHKYYGKNVQITVFSSGEEFLREDQEFQIIFMDIEMPGKDGFSVSKEYMKRFPDTLIIIMTTHTELSRLGYRINAFRYIDKLHKEEIEEALTSAERVLRRFKRISLKFIGAKEQEVCCKDILYFEASNHNVLVVCRKGTFECRESIGELEKVLNEYGFYLIHRAYLVNLDSIKDIMKRDVILYNGDKLPVSRRKHQELQRKYIQWKFENANA